MSLDNPSLAKAIRAIATTEGVTSTAIAGVRCARYVATRPLQNRRWRACLAVVAEGTKELVLGSTTYALSPGHYTVTPLSLPLTSRIATAPFGCVLIALDPALLSRVVADMDARDEQTRELPRGIFLGEVDAPMGRAVARLAEWFDEEEAGRVLGDGSVRELLFHLLRGPNGPAIRRFVHAGSVEARLFGEAPIRNTVRLRRDATTG